MPGSLKDGLEGKSGGFAPAGTPGAARPVQKVRTQSGELQEIEIEGTYRVSNDQEPDLASGITEEDLADPMTTGVGQHFDELDGRSPRLPQDGRTNQVIATGLDQFRKQHGDPNIDTYIVDAVTEVVQEFRDSLIPGWWGDSEFVEVVARLVLDRYEFDYNDVSRVIRSSGGRYASQWF